MVVLYGLWVIQYRLWDNRIIYSPEYKSKATIYSSKKTPQTTNVLLWLCPQDFIHQIIILMFCYIICSCCFMFVLLPCSTHTHKKKKSRVIKFWGFFMYLLFLGIVQNYKMKLDNALIKEGKLYFGKNLNGMMCFFFFPSFLLRAFHWNWITGSQNSLQRATIKFQIGIVSFSLHFIVPNLGTPFRSKRIKTGVRRQAVSRDEV